MPRPLTLMNDDALIREIAERLPGVPIRRPKDAQERLRLRNGLRALRRMRDEDRDTLLAAWREAFARPA